MPAVRSPWCQCHCPSSRKPHPFPAPPQGSAHRGPAELPGWLVGPRFSVTELCVFPGIPAAPSRALQVAVARVRSCCPRVTLCSSVQSLRLPWSRFQDPETQAAAGRAGHMCPTQARFPKAPDQWSCSRGLVPMTARGLEPGWSLSHPVPQDPALAVQLRHLLCRAPGPGISHVWLVSCREMAWSVPTAAFLHSHPICPPTPASSPPSHLSSCTQLSTHCPTHRITIRPPSSPPLPRPHHPPICPPVHQHLDIHLPVSAVIHSPTHQDIHHPLTHDPPTSPHSPRTHSSISHLSTHHMPTIASSSLPAPHNTPTSLASHTHIYP